MRLIAYLRVSTDGQLDGFGPQAQQASCETFAARGGHTISKFVVESITGKALDRPEFRSALDLIEDDKADGILVARFDRLARQLTVQEALLALVWGYGGRVFTADTGEVLQDDPDDPMRTAMRQMAGVMAEFDRASTVSRLKRGRQAKAAAGLYAGGGVPYGSHVVNGVVVDHPEEQKIIALGRSLFVKFPTYSDVARRLNALGLKTRTGKSWTAVQVRRFIAQ
jgi:DNA invertase Pin-like site-specific DNA recombinase